MYYIYMCVSQCDIPMNPNPIPGFQAPAAPQRRGDLDPSEAP